MSEKTDRKQLRQPDEFQQVAGRTMEWVAAHTNQVLGAVAVIALVALGAWGISAYRASHEQKAGAELAEALALESRPIAGEGAAQPGEETFPSKDERTKATLAALEKVRADQGGTTAGNTAIAQIGFQKLKSGDAAGAEKDLQEFLSKANGDHPLRPFALESLGYALEGQGKLDEAKATFAKLADVDMKDRAAFHAARLALIEGKPDAKAQLEQVAKDYPKEAVSMEANQRLEIAALPKYDPSQAPAPAPAPVAPPAKKPAGKVAPKK